MNQCTIAVVCLALAGLFQHCQAPDRALNRGSTVAIAHPFATEWAVDPFDHMGETYMLFSPLMRINESGELEGVLAESWDHDSTTNEVIYRLRRDLRWHDGVPVTAHDVKFSMDLMTHPDVLKEGPNFFGTVEALDDSTLRVRNSMGGVHEVFWPKHLIEGLDPAEFRDWDFWKRPVGNGPYRFVAFQPNVFLELDANDDYFDGKPAIEKVVFKYVGDARVRELMAGNVDMAHVRPIDALALADDPRFNVYHHYLSWWVQTVLCWQRRNPLFEEAEVRRALTMAIDRRGLFGVNHIPESAPIVDAPYSLRQLARNEFPEPIPYNPEQAKSLLDRAGWRDGNEDGVREKQGTPFRFTVLVASQNADTAIFIREQLRKVGVEMEILTVDAGIVNRRVNRGEFDAAIRGFILGFGPSLSQSMGYDDAGLNDLTKALLPLQYHADPEQERFLYDRLSAIFRRDVPITFLGPRISTTVAHRRIQGLSSPWQAGPGATFWRFPISGEH